MMVLTHFGARAVLSFTLLLATVHRVGASSTTLTIYWAPGQTPFLEADATSTGIGVPVPTALDQSLQAYNKSTLIPPPPPGASAMPTVFSIAVSSTPPAGASMQQKGSFFGFSLEMSVVNQVLGKNSSLLQVPFLNLMANLQQRVGRVDVRVGGNTQETATLVPSTSDGKILEKDKAGATNPTQTPPLIFTPDLIQMMRDISGFVNVHWYLGVPFNDSSNWRLEIVEQGQAILGDYLIGIQAGNEPDLYAQHQHRPQNYSQDDYFNEFGSLIQALNADPKVKVDNLLLGPSVSVNWSPESVLNAGTGFIPTYNASLYGISVEHYPFDNCGVAFPNSGIPVVDPQALLPIYLSHASTASLVAPYINSAGVAQAAGKPYVMFETNTASCGGFVGFSDAFGAALWGLDYAMQMASVNFTSALFHIGGQSVSYNPFTPPPTNESVFHQWTVGPIYYSALVTAEALGPTNTSQIFDLAANNNNTYTPAYGIWERGSLARVLLINLANDPTGASDYEADITIAGGPLPTQVDVKYLLAADVTQKSNFTWAGQTFGGSFQSDGRPNGAEVVNTTTCGVPSDGSTQTPVCRIRVPAPGAALVFLTGTASAQETSGAPSATFSTSTYTKNLGAVATVPRVVMETSNGHGGSSRQIGSTSKGSLKFQVGVNAAERTGTQGVWSVLIGAFAAMFMATRYAW